jgi:hypothetical protein
MEGECPYDSAAPPPITIAIANRALMLRIRIGQMPEELVA